VVNVSVFDVDKSQLLVQVLHRYGYTVHYRSGWYAISCPIKHAHAHGDQNKSASVSVATGYINCHGCGFTGDGFDIMRELEGWDAKQVIESFGPAQDVPDNSGSSFTFARRDTD